MARRWFAEDLRAAAPVRRNPRVVDAFATVPREDFLGEGPWRIHSRLRIGALHTSCSAEPHEICHDVLVAIDEDLGINNGLPSLWAMVFDNLNIAPGETVLQIGAGVGYYAAILAELTGPRGRVIAYEMDDRLATRARRNLEPRSNVEVITADATEVVDLPAFDVAVACAGVTHAPARWISRLADAGRMMLPFTGEDQWGLLLLLERDGDELALKSLGPCGFYKCEGARREREEKALTRTFGAARNGEPELGRYHQGRPKADVKNAWVVGEDYWISKA